MSGNEEAISPVPTRLILVRHGESNATVRRVIGGHRSCDGLSPLGVEQAGRLAERLARTAEIAPDVVISSAFARAVETAEILIGSFAGVPLEIDGNFGEHDPGPELDGITFVDYVARFGQPDWYGDPDVDIFPGGETTAQFRARVDDGLARLLDRRAGSTIMIVCHGGTIAALFRLLLRLPATSAFEFETVNTSLTEFVEADSGRWRLIRYNDAAHLAGRPHATPRAEDPVTTSSVQSD